MDSKPKTSLPPQAAAEIGGSGTYFFKGYITAEEYSIDLQGKYGLQVYDVMRKSDPTIRAILQVCKQPILSAHWEIEPASSDPADLEVAERANFEFFNRNIVYRDIMREGMTFLDFGFFVAEQVMEVAYYNGRPYIGFKKISSRKQRSILKFEMDDGEPGVTQILPSGKNGNGLGGSTANIPRGKLLYVANDQEGENYFGVSLLRPAYKPWKIKDGLEIMGAVALENCALGIPYIKKGLNNETVDEGELQKVRDRLRQQRANEEAFLEFPASIEVGWMDMKGNTTKDVLPYIEYQDRQITLSVLAQFLELGQNGGSGSRAVSADHSRLFVKALESTAWTWQQAFQRDVLNRWVDLNYSNLKNGYPKLIFSTISDEDVKETADAVSALTTAGALHIDRDTENRLRSILNLPLLTAQAYNDYDKQPEQPANPKLADAPDNPTDQNQELPDEKPKATTAPVP